MTMTSEKPLAYKTIYFLFLPLFLGLISNAIAHKNKHSKKAESNSLIEKVEYSEKLSIINSEYKKGVKQIFIKSCYDCHSQKTNYPWYYKLPVIKKIIDNDITEGIKHLDLTNDFPFAGHGTPKEDLEGIKEVVTEKTMPPTRYKVMHWGSGLNKSESLAILSWVNESLKFIEQ